MESRNNMEVVEKITNQIAASYISLKVQLSIVSSFSLRWLMKSCGQRLENCSIESNTSHFMQKDM